MSDGFIADAVLLTCERERRKSGSLEIGERAVQGVEGPGPDPKRDIAQAKERVQCVIRVPQVFTRPKQKEMTQDEEGRGRVCTWRGVKVCQLDRVG